MRRFRLAGQVIDEMDPGLQSILANAYDLRIRPLCLCREPGLAMYIARVSTAVQNPATRRRKTRPGGSGLRHGARAYQ
ncbi:DUF1173 family protein [Aminobacter sp. J44]|uniref:DUF1173 family protein n=1 Tax=Aminobacter sp. J44 TaxID=935262 RepID=UPI00119FA56A|nr:DUF1173 family protein [Aminobacter sp. J44]